MKGEPRRGIIGLTEIEFKAVFRMGNTKICQRREEAQTQGRSRNSHYIAYEYTDFRGNYVPLVK